MMNNIPHTPSSLVIFSQIRHNALNIQSSRGSQMVVLVFLRGLRVYLGGTYLKSWMTEFF